MEIAINYWAVLLAALAYMALGYAWYLPQVFGRKWANLMGWPLEDVEAWRKRQEGMGKIMGGALLSALIMSFVLAHFVVLFGAEGVSGALSLAIWTWLGFIATTSLTNALFGRKPKALWAIDAFYPLVGLMIMSIIVTYWQ